MTNGLADLLIRSFTGRVCGTLALIFVCFKVWSGQAPNMNWDIALSGFSPIDWFNHFNIPQNFERDFPQGSHSYSASLFMHIYKLAYSIVGISPERLISGVVLFEILFMGFASVVFFRALIPNTAWIAAFVFAILVVNSNARTMELAGFGGPFFWGLYYNFADGTRLLAVALVLKRRLVLAALLFALSVMTHPLMGAMGGIFALGCFLCARDAVHRNKLFLSAICFLLLVGSWWFYHLWNVDLVSVGIPADIWISFSKAFNYHFYPVDNGLLTFAFERRFLGFISLLLLAVFYVYRIDLPIKTRNGTLLGGGLLLLTTAVGLSISYWSDSPALIRLTLTRASDMLILVGLAVVIAGILNTLERGRAFQSAIAAGLLFAPFIGPAFPVIYVFLAIASGLPIFQNQKFTVSDQVILSLAIAFGLLLFVYWWLGFVHSNYETAYLGHKDLWWGTFWVGVAVLAAGLLRPISAAFRGIVFVMILVSIIPLTMRWKGTVNHGPADKPLGMAFMKAQLWAKENTSPSSLFMIDPTIYYGWRDFSQRSSFGNVREWLHTSWLYDSRTTNYEEGRRRAAEFSISMEDYLHQSPPLVGFDKLDRDIRANFYSFKPEWFEQMSERYLLDYVVMRKEYINNRLPFSVEYENDFYLIQRLRIDK